jgi:hypothetical protein
MTNLGGVVQQLKKERERAVQEVDRLDRALAVLGSLNGNHSGKGSRRGKMSAEGRARVAAAQRKRWAKLKRAGAPPNVTALKKRTLSAEARRKIAAAQRARWAKVKAAKKNAA